MRARFKGPSGTGVLELPDDATVQAVFDELRSKTGIKSFSIKYGPPMAMKTLTLDQRNELARSLGLHGDTLTISPDEARPITPVQALTVQTPQPKHSSRPLTQSGENPEDINVPWTEREGTLCKFHSKLILHLAYG